MAGYRNHPFRLYYAIEPYEIKATTPDFHGLGAVLCLLFQVYSNSKNLKSIFFDLI